MSEKDDWSTRRKRALNRYHASLARFGARAGTFTSQPEPRIIGSVDRGRELCRGNFLFAGYLVDAPTASIWDLPMPDEAFEIDVHGFAWLDDLAAYGEFTARSRAQDWTHDWVRRFGRGQGPGWRPDIAGRRLMRWISHAVLLLNGCEADESQAFFKALSRQSNFLARRWKAADPGLQRFEALCGLIHASLSLSGMDRLLVPACKAIARECEADIDDAGGITTRNPEET